MAVSSNVLEMIGDTPMVELRKLDAGPCRLFAKLEMQNPGGSIKDRIGLSMIEAAEKDGALAPGGTLVEATAGNTGLGLALVAPTASTHASCPRLEVPLLSSNALNLGQPHSSLDHPVRVLLQSDSRSMVQVAELCGGGGNQ